MSAERPHGPRRGAAGDRSDRRLRRRPGDPRHHGAGRARSRSCPSSAPTARARAPCSRAWSAWCASARARSPSADADVTNQPPEEVARAGVGYVPQVDDVFAPLTVRENLEMGGYLLRPKEVRAQDRPRGRRSSPGSARCCRRPAGKLSGGERKMLAMGRVLMLEPSVFLLDEPTANLAPAIARSLLEDHVRSLAAGRRLGADRRAARPRGAGHLRPHLRPRRRRGPDGRHPGRTGRQPRPSSSHSSAAPSPADHEPSPLTMPRITR